MPRRLDKVRCKLQKHADAKLEEARRNLRISEATEKRIASELEQLKKSGTASPETIKNYETYHETAWQACETAETGGFVRKSVLVFL